MLNGIIYHTSYHLTQTLPNHQMSTPSDNGPTNTGIFTNSYRYESSVIHPLVLHLFLLMPRECFWSRCWVSFCKDAKQIHHSRTPRTSCMLFTSARPASFSTLTESVLVQISEIHRITITPVLGSWNIYNYIAGR